MNHRFHPNDWLAMLPWSVWESEEYIEGTPVSGPAGWCLNEHLRARLADQYDLGEPVWKDVFLWGKGDTELRTATKIGGLPYRQAGLPWPVAPSGKVLPFLAQINFTDSEDIVQVPGDILLVFADLYEDQFDDYVLEWKTITPGMRLITGDEIPGTIWRPHPYHGYITRSKCYPTARLRYGDYPVLNGKDVRYDYLLWNYQATEIGRYPAGQQPCDDEIAGRGICVLSSLAPGFGKPHPWVNDSLPLDLYAESDRSERERLRGYPDPLLEFCDGGSIYIYYDDRGEIVGHVSGG